MSFDANAVSGDGVALLFSKVAVNIEALFVLLPVLITNHGVTILLIAAVFLAFSRFAAHYDILNPLDPCFECGSYAHYCAQGLALIAVTALSEGLCGAILDKIASLLVRLVSLLTWSMIINNGTTVLLVAVVYIVSNRIADYYGLLNPSDPSFECRLWIHSILQWSAIISVIALSQSLCTVHCICPVGGLKYFKCFAEAAFDGIVSLPIWATPVAPPSWLVKDAVIALLIASVALLSHGTAHCCGLLNSSDPSYECRLYACLGVEGVAIIATAFFAESILV